MELQYDVAYHLRCQLPLRSGRTITLVRLNQWMTYAGLLMGTPDRESNDGCIQRAQQEAQRYCADDARPHLIPPPRRDYLRQPGDMEGLVDSLHVPEWLPMVTCVGSFKDVRPVRDQDKDLSVLAVVWFQDEFALPILEPALHQLLGMDWDSLARDIEI